jgi:hypothetical protein
VELDGEAYPTLWCTILDVVSSDGGGGVRETHQGVFSGGEFQSRMRSSEAQASTFGDGGKELQGTAHDKVGQNGCGAGCRSPMSG